MSDQQTKSGFADVNGAKLYYEIAGAGQAFVMIHAGVADSRQWNSEFAHFASRYQVIRFDMRGYGKSEPVEGEFNILDDLVALLDTLNINTPVLIMGCSMGGGLAIDFALAHPDRTRAIILVGSGPSGLELDAEEPEEQFKKAEEAYLAGNLELAAEIETQIWFDGQERSARQINPAMRKLAYEMNLQALAHDSKKLGKHVRKEGQPAVERLNELSMPVLVIVGLNDIPYLRMAAEYMQAHLATMKKVEIANAAHLPNMDQPEEFQQAVDAFLTDHSL